MKRYLNLFLLVLACTEASFFSCTRPVTIDRPNKVHSTYVNCLFNPQQEWRVFVGKLKELSDGKDYAGIENATVSISTRKDEFSLINKGGGYYTLPGEKPQIGIQYKLEVQIPDYPTLSASSIIPLQPTLLSSSFDTSPTYFVPDNAFDNVKVNRIQLNLSSPPQQDQYYELLAYRYNIDPYCEFVITDSVLERIGGYQMPEFMGNRRVSEESVDRLRYLKGARYTGKDQFLYQVTKYTGTNYWNYLVYEFAEKTRHAPDSYDSSLFVPTQLFSKALHFYNITGDSHALFGRYRSADSVDKDSATIFVEDIQSTGSVQNGLAETQQAECWLDFYAMSEDMFNYQNSYINQMVNAENPFAQPVHVYCNIHNGLGIFAGYQKQRVKLY